MYICLTFKIIFQFCHVEIKYITSNTDNPAQVAARLLGDILQNIIHTSNFFVM